MKTSFDVPPSLEEWAQLNDQADAFEAAGDDAAYEALYPEIEAAWYSAPARDRIRVDWGLLKEVWRSRTTTRGI